MTTWPQNEWNRYGANPDIGGLPGLCCTQLEWTVRKIDLRPLMLPGKDLLTAETRVEIPTLEDIGIDVGQGTDLRILRMTPSAFTRTPQVLVEGIFEDPHPDEWLRLLAEHKRAVLYLGDEPPSTFSTMADWYAAIHLAIVQVAVYLTPSGVGLTPA